MKGQKILFKCCKIKSRDWPTAAIKRVHGTVLIFYPVRTGELG